MPVLCCCLLRNKWCADCLMIDGLVGQCGEHLTNLWKRDEGGTGQYPPPTLHVSIKTNWFQFHVFCTIPWSDASEFTTQLSIGY